jgi:hypothetical protein
MDEYQNKFIVQSDFCASSTINTRTMIINVSNDEIIYLNNDAGIIWNKLKKPIKFEDLLNRLKKIDGSFSEKDLIIFLEDFRKNKLIEIK